MTSLGNTIAALRARRQLFAGKAGMGAASAVQGRLALVKDFGPNPGALTAWSHLPETLAPGAPLVVVLHGCMQNAAGYDMGSGWSALADREGFALLFPEQSRANNPNLCFNWFQPGDAARAAGETASIHAMITHMLDAHGLDAGRVFITGLSAGGAMAATLLACHPELFAAGAIIAGLPHGAARTVPQALAAMKGKIPSDAALSKLATAASPHKGPWPRLSIWHGAADAVVAPSNAEALLAQWRGAHGTAAAPDVRETVQGAERRLWRGADGAAAIEVWTLPGLGHGTPIAPAADQLGQAMPYMLAQDISSTARIAAFFGLADEPAAAHGAAAQESEKAKGPSTALGLADILDRALPEAQAGNANIRRIIDSALKQAGLR